MSDQPHDLELSVLSSVSFWVFKPAATAEKVRQSLKLAHLEPLVLQHLLDCYLLFADILSVLILPRYAG